MEKQKKDYLDKVKILRSQLCIGVREGIDLLKQTEGDLEKASTLFKKKILDLTISTVKLPEEKVLPYLEQYRYDAGRTIDALLDKFRLIDGIPQSEPVYILHKWKHHKEEAIRKIAALIEKKERLDRKRPFTLHKFPWFLEEELKHLDPFSLCVMAITEWLDYDGTEPFSAILGYNLDLVTGRIEQLGLPNLAAALRMARDIRDELILQYDNDPELCFDALYEHEDYQEARKYFESNRALLVDKLYDFIKDNVDQLSR